VCVSLRAEVWPLSNQQPTKRSKKRGTSGIHRSPLQKTRATPPPTLPLSVSCEASRGTPTNNPPQIKLGRKVSFPGIQPNSTEKSTLLPVLSW